jgi:hypothetical protein
MKSVQTLIVVCFIVACGIGGVLYSAMTDHRPASVPLTADELSQSQQLQLQYNLAQSQLQAAQLEVENVKLRIALVVSSWQAAHHLGAEYQYDAATASFKLSPAAEVKK